MYFRLHPPMLICFSLDRLGFLCVKVVRTDMQWLMNVRDVVREENDGNRLGNLALVLLGNSSLQDVDAERNHARCPICSDREYDRDIVARASPGHLCSETSGAKARANWDRVLADSRGRNHAVVGRRCDGRSNETISNRRRLFCPSP
jgi:hypothetical protein